MRVEGVDHPRQASGRLKALIQIGEIWMIVMGEPGMLEACVPASRHATPRTSWCKCPAMQTRVLGRMAPGGQRGRHVAGPMTAHQSARVRAVFGTVLQSHRARHAGRVL